MGAFYGVIILLLHYDNWVVIARGKDGSGKITNRIFLIHEKF